MVRDTQGLDVSGGIDRERVVYRTVFGDQWSIHRELALIRQWRYLHNPSQVQAIAATGHAVLDLTSEWNLTIAAKVLTDDRSRPVGVVYDLRELADLMRLSSARKRAAAIDPQTAVRSFVQLYTQPEGVTLHTFGGELPSIEDYRAYERWLRDSTPGSAVPPAGGHRTRPDAIPQPFYLHTVDWVRGRPEPRVRVGTLAEPGTQLDFSRGNIRARGRDHAEVYLDCKIDTRPVLRTPVELPHDLWLPGVTPGIVNIVAVLRLERGQGRDGRRCLMMLHSCIKPAGVPQAIEYDDDFSRSLGIARMRSVNNCLARAFSAKRVQELKISQSTRVTGAHLAAHAAYDRHYIVCPDRLRPARRQRS